MKISMLDGSIFKLYSDTVMMLLTSGYKAISISPWVVWKMIRSFVSFISEAAGESQANAQIVNGSSKLAACRISTGCGTRTPHEVEARPATSLD